MEFTIADILPFLSERGRVELDLAACRLNLTKQEEMIKLLVKQLEVEQAKPPCNCPEEGLDDAPLEVE